MGLNKWGAVITIAFMAVPHSEVHLTHELHTIHTITRHLHHQPTPAHLQPLFHPPRIIPSRTLLHMHTRTCMCGALRDLLTAQIIPPRSVNFSQAPPAKQSVCHNSDHIPLAHSCAPPPPPVSPSPSPAADIRPPSAPTHSHTSSLHQSSPPSPPKEAGARGVGRVDGECAATAPPPPPPQSQEGSSRVSRQAGP